MPKKKLARCPPNGNGQNPDVIIYRLTGKRSVRFKHWMPRTQQGCKLKNNPILQVTIYDSVDYAVTFVSVPTVKQVSQGACIGPIGMLRSGSGDHAAQTTETAGSHFQPGDLPCPKFKKTIKKIRNQKQTKIGFKKVSAYKTAQVKESLPAVGSETKPWRGKPDERSRFSSRRGMNR
jgi:hypothetical protein